MSYSIDNHDLYNFFSMHEISSGLIDSYTEEDIDLTAYDNFDFTVIENQDTRLLIESCLRYKYICETPFEEKKESGYISKTPIISDAWPSYLRLETLEVFTKEIINLKLPQFIKTYAMQEELNIDLVKLSNNKNCLFILIKGFLVKYGGLKSTQLLSTEIKGFIQHVTYKMGTVSDRVNKVQNYINDKTNTAIGINRHLKLPATTMKNILSTARLHFYVEDINNLSLRVHSPYNFFSIEYYSEQQILQEKLNKTETQKKNPKNFMNNCNITYMNSFPTLFTQLFLEYKYYFDFIKKAEVCASNYTDEEFQKILLNLYMFIVSEFGRQKEYLKGITSTA